MLDLVVESRHIVERCMAEHGGNHLTYHNMAHTNRVVKAAALLADKAGLATKEKEDLVLAAIYHDVGYCMGADGHEIKGADIAATSLQELGLSQDRIDRIQELIMATAMSWVGDDHMCQLLVDADMSGLADSDYLIIAEGLRKEKSHLQNVEIETSDWITQNIRFFESHKYLSPEGKAIYNKGKKKNLKWLRKMAAANSRSLTIASSKSAQTQLKTALRNHIDLSAIADNKANIMLSVNAIVITVGVPLLLQRIHSQPLLLIPTIILGLTSLVSMIFATLSTRPQSMNGLTDLSQIPKRKTNLFFFGNFYKMDFEEYEKGMKEVVADSDLLDNSITRDLFYLGKSLGKKFSQLRTCYNVFMIGTILAVAVYIVQLLLR